MKSVVSTLRFEIAVGVGNSLFCHHIMITICLFEDGTTYFTDLADVSLILHFYFRTIDLIITPLYCRALNYFIMTDFRVSSRHEYVNYVFLSVLL